MLNFLIFYSGPIFWSTLWWCYCEWKNSSYYGSCNSYKCKPCVEIVNPFIPKLVSFHTCGSQGIYVSLQFYCYDLHILCPLLFLSDLRILFSIYCGVIAIKSIAKHWKRPAFLNKQIIDSALKSHFFLIFYNMV